MSNQWLRLWHDMPTDPKWRTISRISKQRIGDVIAVFNFMLVTASNAVKRGNITGWNDEDIATALDMETSQIISIRDAMQGRVLNGEYLLGWEKRQPKIEDNSSERVRAYRNKHQGNYKRNVTSDGDEETQCNAVKHNVTLDKDTDKDTESKKEKTNKKEIFILPDWIKPDTWDAFMEVRKEKKAAQTLRAKNSIVSELRRLRSLGHDPNEIIQKSIRNSWKDVFEPKEGSHANSHNHPKPNSVDNRLAALYRAGTEGGGGQPTAGGEYAYANGKIPVTA